MSTYIYATCIASIVAAIPLAWWLKREGDRNWRQHQIRGSMRRLTVALQVNVAPFVAAMASAAVSATRAAAEFERSMNKLRDDLSGGGHRG